MRQQSPAWHLAHLQQAHRVSAMIGTSCCNHYQGLQWYLPLHMCLPCGPHRCRAGCGAGGSSGEVATSPLIPACRIQARARQPSGTELLVHSTATERAFVPTQEEQMTKAIVCLFTGPHSRLGKRNFFPQEASFPERPQPQMWSPSQPHSWSSVVSEFPCEWQGARHMHSTHAHMRAHKLLLSGLAGL